MKKGESNTNIQWFQLSKSFEIGEHVITWDWEPIRFVSQADHSRQHQNDNTTTTAGHFQMHSWHFTTGGKEYPIIITYLFPYQIPSQPHFSHPMLLTCPLFLCHFSWPGTTWLVYSNKTHKNDIERK